MKSLPSVLNRLLEEISWEGNARHYREGGRGLENVLTAEVFQALDFLPRAHFLGKVIGSAQGGAKEARDRLMQEIEQLEFDLLPGNLFLAEPRGGKAPLNIQPDGILSTESVYCLLEAKRIRRGAFQPEQLAREYLALLQEAEHRKPLLLLVLAKPPPVPVKGKGRLSVRAAIEGALPEVLERADAEFPPTEELLAQVEDVVSFTTWDQIAASMRDSLAAFTSDDPALRSAVNRLAESALRAIEWHS